MARHRLATAALPAIASAISALYALRTALSWLLAPFFSCLALGATEPTLPLHSHPPLGLNRHQVMLNAQMTHYDAFPSAAGTVTGLGLGLPVGAGARIRSRSLGSAQGLGDGDRSFETCLLNGLEHCAPGSEHALPMPMSMPQPRANPPEGSLSGSLDVLYSRSLDRRWPGCSLTGCCSSSGTSQSADTSISISTDTDTDAVNTSSGSDSEGATAWRDLDTPSSLVDFSALPLCATSTPPQPHSPCAPFSGSAPMPAPMPGRNIPISAPKPIRLCDAQMLGPLLGPRGSESSSTPASAAVSAPLSGDDMALALGNVDSGSDDDGPAGAVDTGEPASPDQAAGSATARDVGDFFPLLAFGGAGAVAASTPRAQRGSVCESMSMSMHLSMSESMPVSTPRTAQPMLMPTPVPRSADGRTRSGLGLGLSEAGNTLSLHLDAVLGLGSSSAPSSPSPSPSPSPSSSRPPSPSPSSDSDSSTSLSAPRLARRSSPGARWRLSASPSSSPSPRPPSPAALVLMESAPIVHANADEVVSRPAEEQPLLNEKESRPPSELHRTPSPHTVSPIPPVDTASPVDTVSATPANQPHSPGPHSPSSSDDDDKGPGSEEPAAPTLPSPWSTVSLARHTNLEMLDARLRAPILLAAPSSHFSPSRSLFDLGLFPFPFRSSPTGLGSQMQMQMRVGARECGVGLGVGQAGVRGGVRAGAGGSGSPSRAVTAPSLIPGLLRTPSMPSPVSAPCFSTRSSNSASSNSSSKSSHTPSSIPTSEESSWEACSFTELTPCAQSSHDSKPIDGDGDADGDGDGAVGLGDATTVRRMLSKTRSYMGWRWRISCPASMESFEVLPSPWSWEGAGRGRGRGRGRRDERDAEVEDGDEEKGGDEDEIEIEIDAPAFAPARRSSLILGSSLGLGCGEDEDGSEAGTDVGGDTHEDARQAHGREEMEPSQGGVLVLDFQLQASSSDGSLWDLCVQAMEVFGGSAPADIEAEEHQAKLAAAIRPLQVQKNNASDEHEGHVQVGAQELGTGLWADGCGRWMYHRPGFGF
ncbi:hypothetical protein CONPUDRAFT_167601 [Coniophora puteana RWD-64-598 SS2]|uniref:Uncharacterized protein n=1 Tax=Coniophora puteana (strain RWD-64-598) TaxID=741705 RepID=A0A5M3MJ38_CONPW|nr:uncharacterized protein CONPUDRAFT_167601 [Coniophora puteana RWD-64-598 SS2]EIW78631.1 hypothetical protein CONPUDRAFT_167601 [Coniophora puteana RWD-64-598 SS2]